MDIDSAFGKAMRSWLKDNCFVTGHTLIQLNGLVLHLIHNLVLEMDIETMQNDVSTIISFSGNKAKDGTILPEHERRIVEMASDILDRYKRYVEITDYKELTRQSSEVSNNDFESLENIISDAHKFAEEIATFTLETVVECECGRPKLPPSTN